MLFRIVVVVLAIAASYALYEIGRDVAFFHKQRSPSHDFMVQAESQKHDVTIVHYMNYGAGLSRSNDRVLLEFCKKNPEARCVVRPVPFNTDGNEMAVKMALAAGVQGKFWEFHTALANYDGPLGSEMLMETADLVGLDHGRLQSDMEGPDVRAMLEENATRAYELSVHSSPTILVGKSLYSPQGTLTENELERMIRFEKTGSDAP